MPERRFKRRLFIIVALFILISVFSLANSDAIASYQKPSLPEADKASETQYAETATSDASHSNGVKVRCNVILD